MAQASRVVQAVLPSSKAGQSLHELEQYINRYGHSAVGAAYGGMNLHNVYANGQQVAGLDEAGKLDVLSRLTAFSNSDSGSTQVTVQAGEKLRDIAQRVYGNANLWYVLAEANALSEADTLAAGITLTVPEVKTSSNDSSTFKPYNPSEITGPTSPALPYIQSPDNGCGTLGTIIMIVVLVVVTYFTAGAATNAVAGAMVPMVTAGTITATTAGVVSAAAGAAIGTAVGSTVSQGVGSAMGMTSFSWRQVASDSITAGISAGFGTWAKGVGFLTRGAEKVYGVQQLNSYGKVAQGLVSYGGAVVAKATVGRDTNFSWSSVAATAASAYVGAKAGLNRPLPLTSGETSWERLINLYPGAFATSTLNATSRRLVGGGKQDWRQIAMDAFGSALANSLPTGGSRSEETSAPEIDVPAQGSFEENGWSDSVSVSVSGTGTGDAPRSNAITIAPDSLSTRNVPNVDAITLDTVTVTAVRDEYSSNGWYFYGWNGNGKQWMDLQRSTISPSDWSRSPASNATGQYDAIGNFTAELKALNAAHQPSYLKPLSQQLRPIDPNANQYRVGGEARAVESTLVQRIYARFGEYGNSALPSVAINAKLYQSLMHEVGQTIGAWGSLLGDEYNRNPFTGISLSCVEAFDTRFMTVANVAMAVMTAGTEPALVTAGRETLEVAGREGVDIIGDTARSSFHGVRIVPNRQVGDTLNDRVFARYQQSIDAAYDDFHRLEARGFLEIPQGINRRTYMGQFIDSAARADLKDYAAANGIEDLLDINRRLYDPQGDNYRIPDLRIPSTNQIFDASLAPKNYQTPQIIDFHDFSGGNRVTIVRPTQEGGSYSILNY